MTAWRSASTIGLSSSSQDREHPLADGAVGLRTWQRKADFRWLSIRRGDRSEALTFTPFEPHGAGAVSGMWRVVRRGSVRGGFALQTEQPYTGSQSQRISLRAATGRSAWRTWASTDEG